MADPNAAVTDSSLVVRARRGEPAAFEALARRHLGAAHAVALAILGNGMDAEDICHDAFITALERLDDCRQPDRFAAWLLQIVRNQARNFLDYRRVRATKPLEPELAAARENSARDVERAELRERLEGALTELTTVQREVVLLHDLEGWRHRDIAETLGISEVASRQHIFVARRRLRELLGEAVLKEYTHD
jgi:RNA polymerase sigma-70 factor (ECF subfamily)